MSCSPGGSGRLTALRDGADGRRGSDRVTQCIMMYCKKTLPFMSLPDQCEAEF